MFTLLVGLTLGAHVLVVGASLWLWKRLTIPILFGVLGFSAFLTIVKVGMLVATGSINVFGVAAVLYLDAVVLAPMLGLVVLVRWSKASMLSKGIGFAMLGAAPLGAHMTFVEPFDLRVESHDVTVDPERAGSGDLRLVVLADVQTPSIGAYEQRVLDEVLALDPDLVLVPGDVFQASSWSGTRLDDARIEGFRTFFDAIDAPIVAVEGDCEQGYDLRTLLPEITVLRDEVLDLDVGDRSLRIVGTSLGTPVSPRALAMEPGVDGRFVILLTHRPDATLGLPPSSRIDLTVAGHTHGGQIVVPGFGPPVTLTDVPRAVAAGGLHEIDGNPIFVSRGIGVERSQAPRFRLWCPPMIGVVELTDRD